MMGIGGLRNTSRWFRRHPVMALLAVNAVVMLVAAFAFELIYRWQLVDLYATELRSFNDPHRLTDDSAATILVLGDSFSAGLDTFPHWLQEELGPRWRVVNGGVPGTSVLQASFVLENRLARFSPRFVVYQTYVGNDLLDLRHPVSWGTANPVRNLYWVLMDGGWTSLGFLNYRLGQIWNRVLGAWTSNSGESAPEAVAALDRRPFSVAGYRPRERMLLASDPRIIERQIEVSGPIGSAWSVHSRHIQGMAQRCNRHGAALIVLVIPHCTQVHQRYRDRFDALGALFDRHRDPDTDAYPFADRLRADVESRPRVVVLDPLQVLRRAETSGRATYRNNDDHLSVDGQRIVGRFLAEEGIRPSIDGP